MALALFAWSGAILRGGNGFIAAFVAGMAISCHVESIGEAMQEFGEAEGKWFSRATFLLFGMVSVVPLFQQLQLYQVVYALPGRTVIRMLPVALSFTGPGFHRPTSTLVGWFGPRGLAKLLFAFLKVKRFRVFERRVATNDRNQVFAARQQHFNSPRESCTWIEVRR